MSDVVNYRVLSHDLRLFTFNQGLFFLAEKR